MHSLKLLVFCTLAAFRFGCGDSPTFETGGDPATILPADYLDYSGAPDQYTGGVTMVPISTPAGEFEVWTKRVGNNPSQKLLLLHGGPGATHEYFECFDGYLPAAGIEYHYYDQLESAYSDQPSDSSLWSIDRYVEEVEQVRQALGMDASNFYLLGHSWGGILAIEYALKYPQNLKGVIISNMMASVPDYNRYAEEVLGPQLDPAVLADIISYEQAENFADERYLQLVTENYYPEHVLRKPLDEWPNPVNRAFANLNPDLYVTMQGPSEFGIKGNAKLLEWDRFAALAQIDVPALTIGAAYDTMDPAHMERMAEQLPQGSYLHCPEGSHMAMWDDQKTYIEGLIRFMDAVDRGKVPRGRI